MVLDFSTGRFGRGGAQSRRTMGELATIFQDGKAALALPSEQVVYETFGCAGEVEGEARLLYATTVLQPGRVGAEYFMTRGHFHTNPSRGEFMVTLRGTGALILMDRDRDTWMESMESGSVHEIDGRLAHRVANISLSPLIFLVVWMSDCGHDYSGIREQGFGRILVEGRNGPELLTSQN